MYCGYFFFSNNFFLCWKYFLTIHYWILTSFCCLFHRFSIDMLPRVSIFTPVDLRWLTWNCGRWSKRFFGTSVIPYGNGDQSIWAATWQNQQNECAPCEDSDQPGIPPSLIRVFAVRMKKHWVLSYQLSAQRNSDQTGRMPGWSERRIWSDWADAQVVLSLRWAYSHFVGFVMLRLIWWRFGDNCKHCVTSGN